MADSISQSIFWHTSILIYFSNGILSILKLLHIYAAHKQFLGNHTIQYGLGFLSGIINVHIFVKIQMLRNIEQLF